MPFREIRKRSGPYRNRGDAAEDAIVRFLDLQEAEADRILSDRQKRQLRIQIREAIVRWEATKAFGMKYEAKKRKDAASPTPHASRAPSEARRRAKKTSRK